MHRTRHLAGGTALIVAVVVAGAAGPAQAGRPEVDRHTCAAVGGEFSKRAGTRSCTTTATTTELGDVVTAAVSETRPRCTYHRSCFSDLVEHTFTGTSRRVTTVETVTVRTQRGARPVVVETTTRVLDSVVEPLTCTAEPALDPSLGPLTDEACDVRGLFTA